MLIHNDLEMYNFDVQACVILCMMPALPALQDGKRIFVAKESIAKATQKNANNASEASKIMNTGAEGARKK